MPLDETAPPTGEPGAKDPNLQFDDGEHRAGSLDQGDGTDGASQLDTPTQEQQPDALSGVPVGGTAETLAPTQIPVTEPTESGLDSSQKTVEQESSQEVTPEIEAAAKILGHETAVQKLRELRDNAAIWAERDKSSVAIETALSAGRRMRPYAIMARAELDTYEQVLEALGEDVAQERDPLGWKKIGQGGSTEEMSAPESGHIDDGDESSPGHGETGESVPPKY